MQGCKSEVEVKKMVYDAQPLTNVSQTYVVIVPINQKSEN